MRNAFLGIPDWGDLLSDVEISILLKTNENFNMSYLLDGINMWFLLRVMK